METKNESAEEQKSKIVELKIRIGDEIIRININDKRSFSLGVKRENEKESTGIICDAEAFLIMVRKELDNPEWKMVE